MAGLFPGSLLASEHCPRDPYDFPIVDFHTHAFNLRHLPVEGILTSRGVPKGAAKALEAALVGLVPRYDPDRVLDSQREVDFEQVAAEIESENFEASRESFRKLLEGASDYDELVDEDATLRDHILEELEGESIRESQLQDPARGEASEDTSYRSFFESLPVGVSPAGGAGAAPDIEAIVASSTTSDKAVAVLRKALDIPDTGAGLLRTLRILMLQEDLVLRFLMEREYCETDVFVHHMMDMQMVYNDAPRESFADQLVIASKLASEHAGRIVFFGAFDPFRFETDLDRSLVSQARALGAVGVKFYPPSGYAPSETTLPDRPNVRWWEFWKSRYTLYKQWRNRYRRGADAIDQHNRAFFGYAAREGLIIFSHHTPEGFEAQPGYGRLFADPYHWLPTLEAHPQLRLVLGHSGGGGWTGKWDGSYSQHAYNLCVLFENVFCDFGYLDEVLDDSGRSKLVERLGDLVGSAPATEGDAEAMRARLRDPAGRGTAGTAAWVYPIADKLLFGTDWMMVARLADRRDFVPDFVQVFDQLALPEAEREAAKRAFFGGNAARLLGMELPSL